MRESFSCGRAVDERDVALTQGTVLWRVNPGCGAWRSVPRFRFTSTVSSIQEYPMATSAAVKEAPATKFAKPQLKAIIERIERLEEEKKPISDVIRHVYADPNVNASDVKTL